MIYEREDSALRKLREDKFTLSYIWGSYIRVGPPQLLYMFFDWHILCNQGLSFECS